jgi:Bacterial dnaA protein helix-turn-helix
MSNERLGIYEELRARADRYGELGEKLRRRLLYPPPANGASAQSVNPFMRHLRNRIRMAGKPNAAWAWKAVNPRNMRTIWPEAKFGISLDTVIKTVIDESEITAQLMFSSWQARRYARPRQVVMYMVDRYCPQYSLPQIGFIFSRDHTTISAGIEAVTNRLLDKDSATVDLVTKSHKRLREIAQ